MDQYNYKVVLVVPASSWFRGGDLNYALTKLTEFNLTDQQPKWSKIKTQADLDFCFSVYKELFKMSNYELRVEHPFISVYTNQPKDIDKLCKIDATRVKYVSKPPNHSSVLERGTVVMSREGYDFKITVGKTRQSYPTFIDWADKTNLVKLTGSSRKELLRASSWGGSYFYVKDDRSLTMVKMFLGDAINRVDRVISPVK